MNNEKTIINDLILYLQNEIEAGRGKVILDTKIVSEFLSRPSLAIQSLESNAIPHAPLNIEPQQPTYSVPKASEPPIINQASLYSKYRGSVNSPDVMFVGFQPTAIESPNEKAFSGEVGVLLDKMIKAMGLNEFEYIILNVFEVVQNGLTPEMVEEQINKFKSFVEFVKPKTIVLFGTDTIKALLKTTSSVSLLHGKWQLLFDIHCLPTFHPSQLIRYPTTKKESWQDLQIVLKRLNRQAAFK